MTCLDTLSQISIYLNCATLYFTSKVYVQIFVGDGEEMNHNEEETTFTTITEGWQLTEFLIMLVLVEHALLMTKILIE